MICGPAPWVLHPEFQGTTFTSRFQNAESIEPTIDQLEQGDFKSPVTEMCEKGDQQCRYLGGSK